MEAAWRWRAQLPYLLVAVYTVLCLDTPAPNRPRTPGFKPRTISSLWRHHGRDRNPAASPGLLLLGGALLAYKIRQRLHSPVCPPGFAWPVAYYGEQRFAAKKRGAFRRTFLSTETKGSHEERTLREPLSAPCFLRCCYRAFFFYSILVLSSSIVKYSPSNFLCNILWQLAQTKAKSAIVVFLAPAIDIGVIW